MIYRESDPVAQSLALAKKPHIVISTPGRLVDHLESHSGLDLSRIKFLVLDEADRLLSGDSLRGCLESILKYCPPPERRQTLLFSATMTMDEGLLEILHLKNPFQFSVGPK
jgi:superfamily II DNA/RNA helicase